MRLTGAVTEGSGAVNEDGYGLIGSQGEVTAAWVFDGVTGINGRNYLPGGSDARWIVDAAQRRLESLAAEAFALERILALLVEGLIDDWQDVKRGLDLPPDYDPPAACLILAKRYDGGWRALRLGDSCLLVEPDDGRHRVIAASPNNAFDHWLSGEARKRRDQGGLDVKALLAEFRPQLIAARRKRNRPDGYSILEADPAALRMPEYLGLGWPRSILLCTDGFYRAVDHYDLHDDASLLAACAEPGGAARVLADVREVESDDVSCLKYLRFKPADDATAVMLRRDR